MNEKSRSYNQYLAAGCGLILLVGLIVLAGASILFLAIDRQAARYPGSMPISTHSNYKGLPFEYRWDNSYRTSDNFATVFNWYSITFDLGAEARAIGQCTLLEGSYGQLVFNRHISVTLCGTRFGQMIYVTRSTSLAGRSTIFGSVEDLSQSLFSAKPRPAGR